MSSTLQTRGKRLLTVGELAEWLGVLPSWVYRRSAQTSGDALPVIRVGGHLRYDPAEVETWLESHKLRGDARAAS